MLLKGKEMTSFKHMVLQFYNNLHPTTVNRIKLRFTKSIFDCESLYKEDKHLNQIPLNVFDNMFILPRGSSLSQNCCVIKYIIKKHIIGLSDEEIFGDNNE